MYTLPWSSLSAVRLDRYSLRTLCRALAYVGRALPLGYGVHRSLYDAFHMTFVTLLQQRHQAAAEALLLKHLVPSKGPPKPPPATAPARPNGEYWVEVGGFWLPTDPRGSPQPDDARCRAVCAVGLAAGRGA